EMPSEPVTPAETPATEMPSEPVTPAETPATEAPVEPTVPAETPATEAVTAEVPTATVSTPALDDVAVVNGTPITRAALDEATEAIISQYQRFYAQFGMNYLSILESPDGFAQRLTLESQGLETLVFRVIADAEVAKRGIQVSDAELDEEFTKQYEAFLASQGLNEDALIAALLATGQTIESFKESGRKNIYDQMLLLKLEREIASPIEISDEELDAYWTEHRSEYETPEQVRASHILVETQEEAEGILADLEAGADFATLAREKSIDTGSGAQGGDLGFFGRGAMVAEFEDAAFVLAIGETSGAVQSQYGFHIIRVTDRKDALTPELADVRDEVVEAAEDEVALERFKVWYEDEQAKAEIVVNDPLIEAARKQELNIDEGLAAFEALWAAGGDVDPHVPYVIGTIYETKLQDVINQRAELLNTAGEDPDRDARLAELNAAIEDLREKALSAYDEAMTTLGGHTAVTTRIQAVQSASEAVAPFIPQ
ncbi:MAG: peptidylprolyl isomerase, partial [Candidatus Bipolaricaulota bacterium]